MRERVGRIDVHGVVMINDVHNLPRTVTLLHFYAEKFNNAQLVSGITLIKIIIAIAEDAISIGSAGHNY